jgi:hypothetical protein
MDTHVQPPSKSARWIGYAMSGLVILFLLFDGGIKLVPLEIVTQTSGEIGLPTDPSFARLLGILTLIGVVLYAIPDVGAAGAILLTGYMGGAIATHLRIDSRCSATPSGYLGLLIWGGLYLRAAPGALIPFGADQTVSPRAGGEQPIALRSMNPRLSGRKAHVGQD